MNRSYLTALALALLLLLLGGGVAGAGSAGIYAINWQVLSGGGAPSSNGNISLNGSLGQTAIGLSVNGSTGLSSGFWSGRPLLTIAVEPEVSVPAVEGVTQENTYLPLLVK